MEMGPMGPPEQLKEIAYMVGDWDIDVDLRMGPEAPWTSSVATASLEPILNGGAYQMVFKGNMMDMDFEGRMLYTYDREENRYEGTWIDTIACRESTSVGGFQDGKLVLEGVDLHAGQKIWMRMTHDKRGDNEYVWTMESSIDGENWYTSMKMAYTRKSSS